MYTTAGSKISLSRYPSCIISIYYQYNVNLMGLMRLLYFIQNMDVYKSGYNKLKSQ